MLGDRKNSPIRTNFPQLSTRCLWVGPCKSGAAVTGQPLSEPQKTQWVTNTLPPYSGRDSQTRRVLRATALRGAARETAPVDTEQRGSRRRREAPAPLSLCSLCTPYASTVWDAQPALPSGTHCPAWLGGPRPRCLAACSSACSSASGGSLFQREERVRARLLRAQGGTTRT